MRCILTNRTIGMTSFSIGTNPTIGTNGPSVWRIVSGLCRPPTREKGGEERVSLPHSSRSLRTSHAPIFSFPSFWQTGLSLKQWGENWNVFNHNIEILVKPSHYVYSIFVIFLYVSVVCFNVWLKLSIKDSVLQFVQILSIIFS